MELMKKTPLIAGAAIGGVIAACIAADKALRRRLKQAKDPSHAAQILGRALQRKGKDVASEVKAWLESPTVQGALDEGKDFLSRSLHALEKSAHAAAVSLKKQAPAKRTKARKQK
jgi:hypothetical protein